MDIVAGHSVFAFGCFTEQLHQFTEYNIINDWLSLEGACLTSAST